MLKRRTFLKFLGLGVPGAVAAARAEAATIQPPVKGRKRVPLNLTIRKGSDFHQRVYLPQEGGVLDVTSLRAKMTVWDVYGMTALPEASSATGNGRITFGVDANPPQGGGSVAYADIMWSAADTTMVSTGDQYNCNAQLKLFAGSAICDPIPDGINVTLLAEVGDDSTPGAGGYTAPVRGLSGTTFVLTN